MNGMAASDKIFALLDLPETEQKGEKLEGRESADGKTRCIKGGNERSPEKGKPVGIFKGTGGLGYADPGKRQQGFRRAVPEACHIPGPFTFVSYTHLDVYKRQEPGSLLYKRAWKTVL